MKKYLLLIFALFFVSGAFGQNTDSRKVNLKKSFTPGSNIRELNILHWNDFHARNEPYQIVPKSKEKNPYNVGGTSGMLGYLNKFRNEKSLVLNAGDDFQGSPISSITRGKSQIQLLNLYNLDAFEMGNHELDYGLNSLDSALMLAKFEFLCSNVFSEYSNTTLGKTFVIKEINGVKAGIIGLAPDDLFELIVVANAEGLRMLNTDSVIIAGIAYLKQEKCNLIVLLSHQGVDNDVKLAEKFYGDVDVIVGGHSHTPLHKPKIVNGVLIVQAGSAGRYLGKLDLKIDVQKDTVISYTDELIETVEDPGINNEYAKQVVDSMTASIEEEMSRVIGVLEVDWVRGRTSESNIGQWIADATRAKLKTDITVLNSGGIRKDLPKGNIMVRDIWEICPFGNTINVCSVTGKTLKQMIRNNIKTRIVENPQETPDFLVMSGMIIYVDFAKAREGKEDFLVDVKVGGQEVSDEKTYIISTTNYVAGQFKKFFGEVDMPVKFYDSNFIDRDVLLEQVENAKVINNVVEARIIDVSK